MLIAGKYRLVRLLGEGGMGLVWAALNELTEREVALKLLRALYQLNPESRARLLKEARACGRIVHRNVVEIYDVGQTEAGNPFLVMQLLSGETIAQVLRRGKRLTQQAAASVAVQIARGLGAAHAAGIVHRDLKPGNVFLHREPDMHAPVVKLLDFGVSKFVVQEDDARTATGRTIGSPAYMSPEQVRGSRALDPRSDLWALGVVLFEMITGNRLFAGDTAYGVASEVLGGRIRTLADYIPDPDPRLTHLIWRCLQRDPAKRMASAAEVVTALAAFAGEDRSGIPELSLEMGGHGSVEPPTGGGGDSTPTERVVPGHVIEVMWASKGSENPAAPANPQAAPPPALPDLSMSRAGERDSTSIPPGLLPELEEAPPTSEARKVMLWDDYIRARTADGESNAPPPSRAPLPIKKSRRRSRTRKLAVGLVLGAIVGFSIVMALTRGRRTIAPAHPPSPAPSVSASPSPSMSVSPSPIAPASPAPLPMGSAVPMVPAHPMPMAPAAGASAQSLPGPSTR